MKKLFTFLLAFYCMSASISAQLTDVVTGISSPFGLVLDGNELYISLETAEKVVKIDINQAFPPTVTDVTSTSPNNASGLVKIGNDLYIGGGSDPVISKVNLSDPLPAASTVFLSTGGQSVTGLALRGNDLYIADAFANKISKVDITSPTPVVTDVISVTSPFGIAFKGSELYIVDAINGKVVKFDVTSPNPVLTDVASGVGFLPIGLTFNGNFLYITVNNKLVRIDTNQPNPTVEDVATGLSTPTLCTFNGLDIYIADQGNSSVVKYAVDAPVLSMLAPVCENTTPNNLGGASPTGGVYSGPGVTDNGDGETFSFDPVAAGGTGTYTVTYTLGQSATTTLEVVAAPTVAFTPPATVNISAGVQAGLGGGTPAGGVYSGTGVTDDGNGMTYSFDPAAAGLGTHTITYSYTNANGCSGVATGDVTVADPLPPDNECAGANDINGLFGQSVGMAQTSALWDNTNYTSSNDPMDGISCFEDSQQLTNTIWYSFTGDGNTYRIKTVQCAAAQLGDMQMAVYSGDCGNLTPVACNEDEDYGQGLWNTLLEIDTENGVNYFIMVDGFNGTSANSSEYCLEVTNLSVSFPALSALCATAAPVNLGGATPAGGVYSGPGVTDNGDGMTFSFDPAAAGTGTQTITYTLNGISTTSTIEVVDSDIALDITTTMDDGTGNGTAAVTPSGGTEPYTYEWSSGHTTAVAVNLAAGTYEVAVTDANGCVVTETVEITMVSSTVQEISEAGIQLFPNPTSGEVQLRNVDADEVLVFDNLGRLLLTQIRPGNSLDLSNVPAGVYFLKIKEGDALYSARVVKE